MKDILYILIACCTFISCTHSNKAIKERISGSDSVAINYFKGDGTMDTVVAVKIIRDQIQIKQLSAFIAERSVKGDDTCGYDGSLHFFKMNEVIQDIDFRMDGGDCMYFYFLQDGIPTATALSKEAKEMIKSFRNPLSP